MTAAMVVALAGCRSPEPEAPPPRPPLVEAVEVRTGSLPLEETVYGVVRADNQVTVRPEISAAVAEVLVRSGEPVDRGQLLVRLEDTELREQLRRAEADVRLAEASAAEAQARTLELQARVRRLEQLAEDRLVSPQELETLAAQLDASRAGSRAAAARVDQAMATADERRNALTKTRVRSPVGGRVGETRVEVGMLVNPGTALFQVGKLERVTVEVTLTEQLLARVRPGQPVFVRGRATDADPIEGTLTRVSPFLAAESFTTVGEIDLDNPAGQLQPGMFVTVRLRLGASEQATLIPTSALWEDPRTAERGVFVVDETDGLVAPPAGGRAENPDRSRRVSFRRVGILAEGSDSIGVSGIQSGDWVVIAGQHLLRRNMEDATAAAGDSTEARIRPTNWERVARLQGLQREDLLDEFLTKQRRIAQALGAAIPESEEVVQRALGLEDSAPAGTEPGTDGSR